MILIAGLIALLFGGALMALEGYRMENQRKRNLIIEECIKLIADEMKEEVSREEMVPSHNQSGCSTPDER